MKKCMHKTKNMPSQTSSIFSVLDRWANLLSLPVKSSVYFFSDSKPRACQKLRNGPGQLKICKCPTLGTDKAGKCPAVARGGGGCWAQLELTDALFILYIVSRTKLQMQFSHINSVRTLFSNNTHRNRTRNLHLPSFHHNMQSLKNLRYTKTIKYGARKPNSWH